MVNLRYLAKKTIFQLVTVVYFTSDSKRLSCTSSYLTKVGPATRRGDTIQLHPTTGTHHHATRTCPSGGSGLHSRDTLRMASQYVVSYQKNQHHQGQIHKLIVVVVGFQMTIKPNQLTITNQPSFFSYKVILMFHRLCHPENKQYQAVTPILYHQPTII